MADETEKTEAAPQKAAKSSTPAADKYSVERLLEEAELLVGHPRHVVAGALYGSTGDLSVDQAQSKVEKFLNSEVKEG